jgi:S-adenosylmethionine synthetase
MSTDMNITVAALPALHAQLSNEICEHKGTGHPDSICDGVAEAVSHALCLAYLDAYGEVRHHNVDKALLIGGASLPRFGGGEIKTKMRLIIAGRADPLPGMADVSDLVCMAAREYLATHLQCSTGLFAIESAVRAGSPNLRRVMPAANTLPLSNDTSFGVGFAPYSPLEQAVLDLSALLKSASFRTAFPAAGDDFKIMGVRFDDHVVLTIALAFKDSLVENCGHYFSIKDDMARWLQGRAGSPAVFHINALDDPAASNESGIYLTVSGLSAEHGDDGQVGRGNRVSGLITPSRPMSLEAAAGKNPVSHVGKIYNVVADRLSHALVSQIPGIEEAQVQIVSCIGQPVDTPQLVDIRVACKDMPPDEARTRRIREIALGGLSGIGALTRQLIEGKVRLF